jgi:hypothetical protein
VARRGVIARRRAAVAIGVIALLVIGGFLFLGGDGPGPIDDGPTSPFSFALGNVKAIPTTRTPPADLRDTAREAGAGIKRTMDALYFRAFVDETSWGDYGDAFELFDGRAATRAEADAEILTLGPTANEDFDALSAPSGSLRIVVLTNKQDAPVTAIASVEFEATAQGQGGRASTGIVSVGSFFLRQVGGAWRIFAYRVDRSDETTGGPSPTGSPS